MRKIHFVFFLFILVFTSSSKVFSHNHRGDLENSFHIFLSPSGQQFVNDKILDILFVNGFSVEDFYSREFSHELIEQDLEDFLDNDEQLRELVVKAKDSLERFLFGFDLDKHRFEFKVEQFTFSTFWEHFSINFTRPHFSEGGNGGILATIELEASHLDLKIDRLRALDNNNEFLGLWGLDKLEIGLDERSAPLQVTVPIMIYNTDRGEFRFSVRPAYSNIDLLKLNSNFESPITMPTMGVSINDHRLELNQDEVEFALREAMPELLLSAQELAQDFFLEQFNDVLSEFLNNNFQTSGMDMNAMDPPGAPENEIVEKYNWGVELSVFDFIDDHIAITLGSFVNDPIRSSQRGLDRSLYANEPPSEPFNEGNGFDLALGINKGFINQLIQLSYDRGYFKSFEVEGEDDEIIFSSQPVLKMQGQGRQTQAKLSLEIEHNVTGIQGLFIRNPMRIQFDLNVEFPVINGVIQMVVTGVDVDSINVDDKYIRFFSGRVHKAVVDVIQNVDGLEGMVLVDHFPVPESMGGVDLVPLSTKVDENGHLMMYMDFNYY